MYCNSEINCCKISINEYVYLTFFNVWYHYIITYCYGLVLGSVSCVVGVHGSTDVSYMCSGVYLVAGGEGRGRLFCC
jgi:hypothetical protein